MTPTPRTLAGRRVLLVEDDYFIAIDLKSGFEAGGAEVLGPVPSVGEALALRRRRYYLTCSVKFFLRFDKLAITY